MVEPGEYKPDMLRFNKGDFLLFLSLFHSSISKPLENIFGLKEGVETEHKISPLSISITIMDPDSELTILFFLFV